MAIACADISTGRFEVIESDADRVGAELARLNPAETIACETSAFEAAATALRLTRRPWRAMLAAAGLGLAATWLGILLAYDSYHWPPYEHGWPVSFFVVALVLFLIVSRIIKAAENRFGHHEEAAPPATKECPACCEQVPLKATRCKFCTSDLKAA